MNRLTLLTVMAALAGVTNLWAGEEPREEVGGRIVVQVNEGTGGRAVVVGEGAGGIVFSNAWGAGRSAAAWYIESIDKIVNLAEDQKQTITRCDAGLKAALIASLNTTSPSRQGT